jgi:hypothetical protein
LDSDGDTLKRAILKIPEGLEISQLTQEQQAAIAGVFAQFVMPMPGTIPDDGYIVIDSITGDNYDPETMPGLELPFELLGLWQWDGVSDELVELMPLDAGFTNYLPEGSDPQLPHGFAGWPTPKKNES